MGDGVIKIKKRVLFIVLAFLVLIGFLIFSYSKTSIYIVNQNAEFEELEAKFAVLSQARTNACGGGKTYISQLSADGTRIQGSCCSAMNFHRYTEQIEGLKKYSEHETIPKDPYDVSAEWAEEMIAYTENKVLTGEQQKTYDDAVELSHEKGPCCCKCWHWYAYEGLAKKLIIEYDFTAEQIAEIWDLSDACGGSGHIEGVEGH